MVGWESVLESTQQYCVNSNEWKMVHGERHAIV